MMGPIDDTVAVVVHKRIATTPVTTRTIRMGHDEEDESEPDTTSSTMDALEEEKIAHKINAATEDPQEEEEEEEETTFIWKVAERGTWNC